MSARSARAPRYLSQDERIEIADLRQSGLSVRGSRAELGRTPSTISRELQRNVQAWPPVSTFRSSSARDRARRARHRRRRLDPNADLGAAVTDLLRQRWSPQQISRHPHKQFADNPSMWLCHEKHLSIGIPALFALLRHSPLAPHRRSPLPTGHDHRRAHQRQQRRRPRFQQPMLSIHDRPLVPTDRSEGCPLGPRPHYRQ